MAAKTDPATCTSNGAEVLIAGTGDGGWDAPVTSLAALLGSAGYDVTQLPTLPSDLSIFGQVWWVDTNAPSSAEQSQLVAFEHAGGGVFLTGDGSCCEPLNTADTSMINSMVTGGGVTAGGDGNLCTCTTALTVNSSVVGNLSQQPVAVSQWTVSQPGGMLGVPASSVFAYYQPGDISTRRTVAAAWDRASLIGNGRLVVFMDINWTEPGYRAANWSDVAQNVALFLSGLEQPARATPCRAGSRRYASAHEAGGSRGGARRRDHLRRCDRLRRSFAAPSGVTPREGARDLQSALQDDERHVRRQSHAASGRRRAPTGSTTSSATTSTTTNRSSALNQGLSCSGGSA